MIDNEITLLVEQPPDKTLDRLEADIWAGVAAQNLARRTGRIIASCQAGVMVVALLGAATVGATTAASAVSSNASITSAGSAFAPSTLLLGQRP